MNLQSEVSYLNGINPIQAGLFWNHIGWAPPCVSPLFVVQLPLNLAC